MPEVKMTPTPVTELNAAKEIIKVLPSFGQDAFTQEVGELILAQVWLETGRGVSLMNHNWGNITAGKSWLGDYWRPPWFNKTTVLALPETTEAQKAQKKKLLFLHEEMLANRAPQKFRAYPSSFDGFKDYIARLSKEFRAIVEAAKTGSPLKFAQAIKDSRYAPDIIPEKAAVTFSSLVKEFRQRGLFASIPKAQAASLEPSSSLEPPEPSSGEPSKSSPVVEGDLPTLRLGSKGTAVEFFRKFSIGGSGPLTKDDIETYVKPWQGKHNCKTDGVIGNLESWPALIHEIHSRVSTHLKGE